MTMGIAKVISGLRVLRPNLWRGELISKSRYFIDTRSKVSSVDFAMLLESHYFVVVCFYFDVGPLWRTHVPVFERKPFAYGVLGSEKGF